MSGQIRKEKRKTEVWSGWTLDSSGRYGRYRQVQAGTGRYSQVKAGTQAGKQAGKQAGRGKYWQVQVGPER
jgi:hypothetical protein